MAMFSTAFSGTQETPPSLTSTEIAGLRRTLISFLNDLQSKKMRMQTGDYRSITEHIKYSLTTLSNMENMIVVAQSDPYGRQPQGTYSDAKTIVYNSDGSSRVVSTRDVPAKGEDWERQFEEGLLQRPPCYMLPPQSITKAPSAARTIGATNILYR